MKKETKEIDTMTKSIDSDKEYERRKKLLEKHKEKERDYWGRQFTIKPLSDLIDVCDLVGEIKDSVESSNN